MKLFKGQNLRKNIGFFIFAIFFGINIINIFLFYCNYYKKLILIIKELRNNLEKNINNTFNRFKKKKNKNLISNNSKINKRKMLNKKGKKKTKYFKRNSLNKNIRLDNKKSFSKKKPKKNKSN